MYNTDWMIEHTSMAQINSDLDKGIVNFVTHVKARNLGYIGDAYLAGDKDTVSKLALNEEIETWVESDQSTIPPTHLVAYIRIEDRHVVQDLKKPY